MVRPVGNDRKHLPVAEVKPAEVKSENYNETAESSAKDDSVTLTKTQLRKIIDVIGQVQALNIQERLCSLNEREENASKEQNFGTDDRNNAAVDLSSATSTTSQTSSRNSCPLDIIASQNHLSSSQVESPKKLSILEQKRLKWEQEKAEMHEWNPWGKPGAGAPARKCQLVAPMAQKTDNQLLMIQTSSTTPCNGTTLNSNLASRLTSPNQCRAIPSLPESNSHDYSIQKYAYMTQPIKPVPPMFRSSIAFGTGDNESFSEESMKQQWIRDFELQEQKYNRIIEHEHARLNQPPDSEWMNAGKEEFDSVSVCFDGCGTYGSDAQNGGRSFMRGQGFKLDPESAARAEERRQKAQEYQQAIRQQMAEKQRRVQEEKARKKQEEEEEEKRLAIDRARIQAEYEEEQRRQKQKLELEERKHKAVVSAVQEAQAQAEAEKRSRKVHKLSPLHENAQVNSSPNSVRTSTDIDNSNAQLSDNSHRSEHADEGRGKGPVVSVAVQPVQCSNSEFQQKDTCTAPCTQSSCRELGVQTVFTNSSNNNENNAGYTVNRVLTPSPYRIRCKKERAKDFGTQTDLNYGQWIGDDGESNESNTSSVWGPVGKRITRVQHSKPYKASRRIYCSEIERSERPKWNANQPSKSYIRMTDRDPHYMKRKKLQELRKQHWEREMATQQALRNARRSIMSSYPSLRHRRAGSSSDCTAGFSSSEFETRSCTHVRSNTSPRRYRTSGFRSVGGSAEELGYYGNSSSAYTTSVLPSMLRRRNSQSSDNLPSIIGGSEPTPSRRNERFSFPDVASCSSSLPPMRRKWHSQEAFYPDSSSLLSLREQSPPVPAIRSRLQNEQILKTHFPPPKHTRRKWSDQESFDLESVALSHAARSQEDSSNEDSDQNEKDSLCSSDSTKKEKANSHQNPLVNPEVITGRPTPRQDRILQNLSSLRLGLLQKQKELQNFLRHPPDCKS